MEVACTYIHVCAHLNKYRAVLSIELVTMLMVYVGTVQFSSHSPEVAVEHLKGS
jgi:hypothetical protein